MLSSRVVLAVCSAMFWTLPVPGQTSNQNKLIYVVPQSTAREISTYNGPPVTIGQPGATEAIRNPANYGRAPVTSFLQPLNAGIAIQLSTLPIASPASAVILKEDPVTGAMAPASQSLGPILTERAETIGRRKFFMGYTRQQFRFDKLDGQELGNFTMLNSGGAASPITQGTTARSTAPVTLATNVDLRINQDVAVFTYGLTNRLDVTAGVTWGWSSVSAVSRDAQIQSNPAAQGGNCWCVQSLDIDRAIMLNTAGRPASEFEVYQLPGVFGSSRQTARGIGDTLIRVKGTVIDRSQFAVAIGTDLRLPTGDAENYLGSGALGFKPFTAISLNTGNLLGKFIIAPHINIGYQVNGDSILASADPASRAKGSLPDQFSYAVGAQWGVRQFTVVTDFLGMRLMDATRIEPVSAQRVGATSTTVAGYTLASQRSSFSMNSFAAGFKVKTIGNLVLTTNALIALDNNGLRDKVVPLFGLSYTLP